ncbi:Chaperone protein DnaK [Trichinella spiralis]|uniref:Chaperone protein DnaK n=2 Tax=Trichinella spiralis TaxID=6334 RepID=A0ABR3K9S6_TRISP
MTNLAVQRMEQRKCENADDTKQIGTHEADRGRHEADRGRHEADRGPHEADRGPHEADRGPHEAEQEKTKFLGPQFCRSGIGILRKGEVIP